jgi:hypothetical protein
MDELKPSPDIRLNSALLLSGNLQQIGSMEWIIHKPRWGAFYKTSLEKHLHNSGVNTVVVCGCNFPNCPRTTIYEASERDFKIVMAKDATSLVYDIGLRELQNIGVSVMSTADEILATDFVWRNPLIPAELTHGPESAKIIVSSVIDSVPDLRIMHRSCDQKLWLIHIL